MPVWGGSKQMNGWGDSGMMPQGPGPGDGMHHGHGSGPGPGQMMGYGSGYDRNGPGGYGRPPTSMSGMMGVQQGPNGR